MLRLTWQGNTPISKDFGDIYYSLEDGEAETRHTFIKGNDLIRRWKKELSLKKDKRARAFVICELGFGSGLNFYLTCLDFLQHSPSLLNLHYIACEKYPLSSRQIRKAMKVFTAVKSKLEEFLPQYSTLDFKSESASHTFQELFFAEGRIQLSLYFGEASSMCKELEKKTRKIDAWFLDGFAPHKNPSMWKTEIFYSMARLAKRETSFATFSAAGKVRRGLKEAGFQNERVAGFASKGQMLRGFWGK